MGTSSLGIFRQPYDINDYSTHCMNYKNNLFKTEEDTVKDTGCWQTGERSQNYSYSIYKFTYFFAFDFYR